MIDLKKLEQEQLKLAKKVVIRDEFEKIETVAGVDQAFFAGKVVSAIVVCSYPSMDVIEKAHAEANETVPYFPNFLSYRESPAIVEAFTKLHNRPDILLVDGNGILHPRRIGMASHVGIILDIPTIGIAKKLFIGKVKEGKVYAGKEMLGYEFISREHAKPIYVSPGYKVSLPASLNIVKDCMKMPHKLPEPLHLAHREADRIREEMAGKKKEK